MSFADVNN